jgi:hypothetical protein
VSEELVSQKEESLLVVEQTGLSQITVEQPSLLFLEHTDEKVSPQSADALLIQTTDKEVVTQTVESVFIFAAGEQGPRGIKGDVGVEERIYQCAVDLSGERVAYVDADGKLRYADSSDLDHAYQIAGVTTQAGLAGAEITARSLGPLIFSGWNWMPNKPIFLGSNGNLTQVVPTTGAILIVAGATSPTAIFIRVGRPIWRS